MLARMVDQDAPHHLRRDAEEVRAILPVTRSWPASLMYASWTRAVGCSVWSRRSRRR